MVDGCCVVLVEMTVGSVIILTREETFILFMRYHGRHVALERVRARI